MNLFGPPVYTKQDAISDLLRFTPLTGYDKNGEYFSRPTKWSKRLVCTFGRKLILALRGVP